MIKRYLAVFGVAIMAISVLQGCGAPEEYVGMETIVETSQKRVPKWVKKPPKPSRKYYYFVGQEDGKTRSDVYAYQRAIAEISSFLNTRAETFYSQKETSDGLDTLSKYRENYIQMVSNSSIRGALRKERYMEKVKKTVVNGHDRFFRHYVLVAISKKDLKASEERTLTQQLNEAKATDPAAADVLLGIRDMIQQTVVDD
jgi:hypothetical protein|tara:strand:+ start:858 stop:1457 length:600 start_codon:yes stop_codon:yes gene_type:complete